MTYVWKRKRTSSSVAWRMWSAREHPAVDVCVEVQEHLLWSRSRTGRYYPTPHHPPTPKISRRQNINTRLASYWRWHQIFLALKNSRLLKKTSYVNSLHCKIYISARTPSNKKQTAAAGSGAAVPSASRRRLSAPARKLSGCPGDSPSVTRPIYVEHVL